MSAETRPGRRGIIAVVAVSIALMLTGCVGAATGPEPTPTGEAASSAPPTGSAPPVDPLDTVVSLVLRPQALELRDASGATVKSLDYTGDAAAAVEVLTAVVGSPAQQEVYRATNHTPPGVMHSWGDLVLDERSYDPQVRIDSGLVGSLRWPSFAIYFDGPAVVDLDLTTDSGLHAQADWASVQADGGYDDAVMTCSGTVIDLEDVVEPSGRKGRAAVVAQASEDAATALWLGAPEMEADGCA